MLDIRIRKNIKEAFFEKKYIKLVPKALILTASCGQAKATLFFLQKECDFGFADFFIADKGNTFADTGG